MNRFVREACLEQPKGNLCRLPAIFFYNNRQVAARQNLGAMSGSNRPKSLKIFDPKSKSLRQLEPNIPLLKLLQATYWGTVGRDICTVPTQKPGQAFVDIYVTSKDLHVRVVLGLLFCQCWDRENEKSEIFRNIFRRIFSEVWSKFSLFV